MTESGAGSRLLPQRGHHCKWSKTRGRHDGIRIASAGPGDYRHFVSLVTRHSVDETTRGNKGDLGFFEAGDGKVEAGVRTAAFGIKTLWGISGPVRYGQRWAVVMKTGFRPVIKELVEGRRKAAKRRLLQRRRSVAVRGSVEGLDKVEPVVFEKSLKVTVMSKSK